LVHKVSSRGRPKKDQMIFFIEKEEEVPVSRCYASEELKNRVQSQQIFQTHIANPLTQLNFYMQGEREG